MPACDHLSEAIVWRYPPTWCGCADLLRCGDCYRHHITDAHAHIDRCQGTGADGEPCGHFFGPEVYDPIAYEHRVTRHRIDWTHRFDTIEVRFPSLADVVLDFDDATIIEAQVVCLGCAAEHETVFGSTEF